MEIKYLLSMSHESGSQGSKNGGRGRGYKKNHRGNYRGRKKSNDTDRSKTSVSDVTEDLDKLSLEDQKRRQRASRFSDTPTRLGDYGFVSRGEDNRLQRSSKERDAYFQKIMKSFSQYCADNDKFALTKELHKYIDGVEPEDKEGSNELVTIDSILASLRKLREAMINSTPNKFMVHVFLFSIRISALIGHYQTYIPSINYLLSPELVQLLEPLEIRELSTLLILHLVHFNNQCTKALEIYYKYFKSNENSTLLTIINSWVLNDYHTWTKIYNLETDNAKSTLMRYGIKTMVQHIVLAIEKSYFNLDKSYLNNTILPNGVNYSTLLEKYDVKWQDEGTNIIVKKRKLAG